MRTTLDTHPRVFELSEILKLPKLHIIGMCWRIWSWADTHSVEGNEVRVTCRRLDELVSVPGFADALRKVGWLTGRDYALSFPRFADHNGQTAKQRAETANRVARHRNAKRVTDPLPEKRREEKNKPPPPTPSAGVVEGEATETSIEERRRLEEDLISLGSSRCDCVATALGKGVSAEQIRDLIAHWRTWHVVNGWQVGALYFRIANAHPAQSVNDGWPLSPPRPASDVSLLRQREEALQRKADEEQTRIRREEEQARLESELGSRLDAMSREEITALADQANPLLAKLVRRQLAERKELGSSVRVQLMRLLAQE